ncbi:MAG: hypothetical protein ACLTV6_06095 [Christensenellales bacterium]
MITLATAADLPQILAIMSCPRVYGAARQPEPMGSKPPNGNRHYRAHRRA